MGRPSSTGVFACTWATLAGSTRDDELPSEHRGDRLFCRPSMRPNAFMLVLALAGCGSSSQPPPTHSTAHGDEENADVAKTPHDSPSSSPRSEKKEGDTATASGSSGPNFACRLSAPVSSDDACSKDADCAPSVPCHARACVAVSKAVARTPDTVCSMNIDCSSADVNPCTCYQGRCALVPKSP